MTRQSERRHQAESTRTPGLLGVLVLVVLAALLALATGSTHPPATGGGTATATLAPRASTASPTSVATGPTSSPTPSPGASSTDPRLKPVPPGELTRFEALHGSRVLIDAPSSGLARYNTSDRCEVPGQPCYDAPYLDKVARIDLGAPPTVPGTQTTFVTGHSNRFHPDDPSRGVLTRLQRVRTGDTLVLTTTAGRFQYEVTDVLEVPFDKLTSTPEVVTVRPDTVVVISCVIAPDHSAYLGNYVVIGSLRASQPR